MCIGLEIYTNIGDWSYEYCDSLTDFICKKPLEPVSVDPSVNGCPKVSKNSFVNFLYTNGSKVDKFQR